MLHHRSEEEEQAHLATIDETIPQASTDEEHGGRQESRRS
jgi:hypothetical protein